MNRSKLLAAVALVRPALATRDYIPALTHVKFDGDYATAFDDVRALSVECPTEFRRLVPGDLLMRALGSFSGEEVAAAVDPRSMTLHLSSGRAKVRLPTLDLDRHPFSLPSDVVPEVPLSPDVLAGIARCLMSVGTDEKHAAAMGVTLDADTKGHAVLYSTDNKTMSRYCTQSKIELPGGTPVILPTFFCEQLVALRAAFPEEKVVLALMPGGLLADFGTRASVYTRIAVDHEPLDFARVMAKHEARALTEVPAGLDEAVGRALLVLSGEAYKVARVQAAKGTMSVCASSALGEADDEVAFAGGDAEFSVDAALLQRALKSCANLGFADAALVLADAQGAFTHIIGHVRK